MNKTNANLKHDDQNLVTWPPLGARVNVICTSLDHWRKVTQWTFNSCNAVWFDDLRKWIQFSNSTKILYPKVGACNVCTVVKSGLHHHSQFHYAREKFRRCVVYIKWNDTQRYTLITVFPDRVIMIQDISYRYLKLRNWWNSGSDLTHWPLGDLKIFFKMSFSNSYPESIPWAIPAKLLSEVCHRTPLMISQHWFR